MYSDMVVAITDIAVYEAAVYGDGYYMGGTATPSFPIIILIAAAAALTPIVRKTFPH
ncbi:MAG: hypothetical protein QXJ13_07975 [Candidatus Bathyarchaeia archaeon]